MTAAVFLDRDGTIIELKHHLTDPADVRLLPGSGTAIARLKAAGLPVVIVTNQSVIGRGKMTEDRLTEVHQEMNRQLAAFGAEIETIYHCPLAPRQTDQRVVEDPMRKPGPGMLQKAARDHGLDLDRSWMVGDTVSDMGAGRNSGCRTVLVETGYGDAVSDADDLIDHRLKDLPAAVDLILGKDER